jgi:hypothetical protein
MSEHRTSPRRKAYKAAKILLGKNSVIDCTLRNVSKKGACVEVVSPVGIPNAFQIAIGDEVRDCRIEWTTAKRLGVAFL